MITIALFVRSAKRAVIATKSLPRPNRTARTTSPFFTVPVALASFTFASDDVPNPSVKGGLADHAIIVAIRAPVFVRYVSLIESAP